MTVLDTKIRFIDPIPQNLTEKVVTYKKNIVRKEEEARQQEMLDHLSDATSVVNNSPRRKPHDPSPINSQRNSRCRSRRSSVVYDTFRALQNGSKETER